VEKFGKKMWKKIGVEKTWISVEKCQREKKRDKFPWKNITYLVVVRSSLFEHVPSPLPSEQLSLPSRLQY
jgi:hypothetical protein